MPVINHTRWTSDRISTVSTLRTAYYSICLKQLPIMNTPSVRCQFSAYLAADYVWEKTNDRGWLVILPAVRLRIMQCFRRAY